MRLELSEAIPILQDYLENDRLVLFAGSGISVPAPSELPTWDAFLLKFIDICENLQNALPSEERFSKLLRDAKAGVGKHPVRVATSLKTKLLELSMRKKYNVDDYLSSEFLEIFSGKYNSLHESIVKTNYPYIVTSNYDQLFEQAANKLGFSSLRLNSFSFKEPDKLAAAIYERRHAIIHVHGKLTDIAVDDFVFTAKDYVEIKRKYPGFTLALQSLFLRYSVLFVGYGGSDPHLEDFVEEMSYMLEWSGKGDGFPRYFMVLLDEKVDTVLENYKDAIRTEIVVAPNHASVADLLAQLQTTRPRHNPA